MIDYTYKKIEGYGNGLFSLKNLHEVQDFAPKQ